MTKPTRSIETEVVHAGEPRPRIEGAVTMPIFQTSTYALADAGDYHDIRYLRLNNSPNHIALHAKLAALEGAESALVAASGMAAITTALLSAAQSGDHILAQDGLYGGTHTFMTHELPALGISVDFVDLNQPASWRAQLRDSTRAFYVESMTNPLLEVGDLTAVVAFAREHGLTTLIDNTLTSPFNFRPLDLGFDLSLHSATKYLNGHSDIVAGAVAGGAQRIDAVKRKLDHYGGALDAHACFLLHRGIKTLPLRMARQNDNALALARFLRAHPAVAAVHYAGLDDHPTAARAAQWFRGCGGMLSFDHSGGAAGAQRMIARLELAAEAVSLGGVETLVTRPAQASHVGLTQAERDRIGIGDGLVRVAVGIEGVDDLIADFEQALG